MGRNGGKVLPERFALPCARKSFSADDPALKSLLFNASVSTYATTWSISTLRLPIKFSFGYARSGA
jgi:hypothetical protein